MNSPNIILITIDCARADVVTRRASRSKIPNLVKIASQGISYENAFSHGSYTRAAFISIFSSTYKSQYSDFGTYTKNQPNFVEILRDNGYNTIGVNSNRFLSKDFGYGRGFGKYEDLSEANPRAYSLPVRIGNNALSMIGGGLALPPYPSAESVTDVAIDLLEDAQRPYFLWIHYMDAHWPYNLDEIHIYGPWNSQFNVYNAKLYRKALREPSAIENQVRDAWYKQYIGGLRKIDHHIGRLVKHFDDNSAVFVTSDHGEAFGEHGNYFHHSAVYAENLHIPLIAKSPGLIQNHVERGIVRHIDLAPTILDISDLDPDPLFLGISLLPAARGNSKLPDLVAISEVNRHSDNEVFLSMRKAGWSVISTFDIHQERILKSSIYHYESDPNELNDLSKQEHIRLAIMESEMFDFYKSVGEFVVSEEKSDQVSDKKLQGRLRALGYIE